MFRQTLRSWTGIASAGLVGLLSGCAISTPFKTISSTPPTVVMVVTHAVLDPNNRAAFDAQTSRVLESLSGQPGLVGYSVRRQLLGNEVWTMTVWASEASRAEFVTSAAHRTAMVNGNSALQTIRLLRVELPQSAVPMAWADALQLLEARHTPGYSPPLQRN
ncbi:MAG: antibiotic biosynthesis monooxygenase family protein [Burkholderiaceae bacterium]